MNIEAVRAFVRVAEHGRFQDAGDDLGVTQQAVSKRIAGLEQFLGVPLFTRGRRGAELTVDGQAFLPHAKAVLVAVQGAVESVRPESRAFRVDVLGRRLASADLVLDFHERRPDVPIDVLSLGGARPAFEALLNGSVDAAFCCVRGEAAVPAAIRHARVYDEPLDLLVGPRHPLAGARRIRPVDLREHRIWVPGIVAGSEWGGFYAAMAEAFGIDIDATGPNFGMEHLFDTITDSATLTTFAGTRTRIAWPMRHELRRVPIRDPMLVYPWSLAWHEVNRHPALGALRDHLRETWPPAPAARTWTPSWTPPWHR